MTNLRLESISESVGSCSQKFSVAENRNKELRSHAPSCEHPHARVSTKPHFLFLSIQRYIELCLESLCYGDNEGMKEF